MTPPLTVPGGLLSYALLQTYTRELFLVPGSRIRLSAHTAVGETRHCWFDRTPCRAGATRKALHSAGERCGSDYGDLLLQGE